MTKFSITKPDDLHVHLRDGEILKAVAPHTARNFARAIVMPNLVPPVTTTQGAHEYYTRIKTAAGANFEPLMVLYLTDKTSPAEIALAAQSKVVKAVKLYPSGATTNSDHGVTDISKTEAALAAMEEHGIPLLVHGEVTNKEIDIFDREAVFIERVMIPLTMKFPKLKIVFEHITTRQAASFVLGSNDNIAATITPQHLLFNRNHMLVGGVRPHYYCLPVLKREEHREALVAAALSGNKKIFAGTDSAPHLQFKKEHSCGCAGCFNSTNAVELYAEVFDAEDLSREETQKKFENFMSRNGAEFYGLPYNTGNITLVKKPQRIAEYIDTAEGRIIPLMAGETINWSVE